MPRIQWTSLSALLDHLFERRAEQHFLEDLYRLKEWRESEPDAPDGYVWSIRSFQNLRRRHYREDSSRLVDSLQKGEALD